ncbi:uncharacterized protein PV09_09075 [Verruconis gallopava]|uniref:EamA domain-containing protein n=1 Tax=Verruconis gallopava TaxID=253628 RepID=A0A0D1YEP8_9PEZI|nr:uncharacterized protein PV09_09075 [Verruconis gallopava]KIV99211.1 hypothetical protein PV09_09075 [Verruconis gallopava]
MSESKTKSISQGLKTPWQSIAVASGTCAALNAIFAKLTTNDLTTSLSIRVADSLYLPLQYRQYLDLVLRVAVFGISFLFTGTMWALYTKALTASPSAIRVNIVNTSSNFIVTALLGAIIFGENLPLLWWVGASFLIAGSVIISQRDDVSTEVSDADKIK